MRRDVRSEAVLDVLRKAGMFDASETDTDLLASRWGYHDVQTQYRDLSGNLLTETHATAERTALERTRADNEVTLLNQIRGVAMRDFDPREAAGADQLCGPAQSYAYHFNDLDFLPVVHQVRQAIFHLNHHDIDAALFHSALAGLEVLAIIPGLQPLSALGRLQTFAQLALGATGISNTAVDMLKNGVDGSNLFNLATSFAASYGSLVRLRAAIAPLRGQIGYGASDLSQAAQAEVDPKNWTVE
jgi:hypothetical protein